MTSPGGVVVTVEIYPHEEPVRIILELAFYHPLGELATSFQVQSDPYITTALLSQTQKKSCSAYVSSEDVLGAVEAKLVLHGGQLLYKGWCSGRRKKERKPRWSQAFLIYFEIKGLGALKEIWETLFREMKGKTVDEVEI